LIRAANDILSMILMMSASITTIREATIRTAATTPATTAAATTTSATDTHHKSKGSNKSQDDINNANISKPHQ
jgi:hypothetical protein